MIHKHFIRSSYEFLKLGTRKSKDQIKKLYTAQKHYNGPAKIITAWRSFAQSLNFSLTASAPRHNMGSVRFRTRPI